MFEGERPETIRAAAQARGLRIVGLSQVYPFNAWTDAVRHEVITLIGLAKACGAETISLIPRNDGQGCAASERGVNLRNALREIAPLLQDAGLVALVFLFRASPLPMPAPRRWFGGSRDDETNLAVETVTDDTEMPLEDHGASEGLH